MREHLDGCGTPTWWCVPILTPPLVFIGGSHQPFVRELQLYPLEPTLGASEELPRVKDEAVGPTGLVGRPWRSADRQPAPNRPIFGIWAVLVSLVLIPWVMAYPKLVCLSARASFDPFQPDSHALIGCALLS